MNYIFLIIRVLLRMNITKKATELKDRLMFCLKRLKVTSGAPRGIRTPNPRFRRPMLYPIELWMLVFAKVA